MEFLKQPTRHLFFTGKGGVGKTSVACAAAVRLADSGKRVLLVSTDPASNLDEVLGTRLGHRPTEIDAIPRLLAMNLDPEAAAAEYRERMIGPYRTLLPASAVASMEEQFSGSCTLEIAAFDEFSKLLGDRQTTAEFEHVIFDTAPTGHTLRLLTLPSAWSGFMATNTTGTSCLGPLAGLQPQQTLYADTVQALGDAKSTTLILVTRPEESAFREAARTSGELSALGVQNQHLVVNGVFHAAGSSDRFAVAMQQRGEKALAELPEQLRRLPRTVIPLTTGGVLGVDALRALGERNTSSGDEVPVAASEFLLPQPLIDLLDYLAAPGRGVIMAMGKGGVGKTTVSAAVAVALAGRGYRVHLSTTDPAAHLVATIAGYELSNLSVSRIDPEVETARYSDEVMHNAGAALDAQGKALLAEDLRSPCTEEIAVFRAFAQAVAEGSDRFVVLDTAPTGHTILLLDAALAYHREVTRQASAMPEFVRQLLPRLRDPEFTRVLLVTLPEATPVHEAAQLQRDLRRAEIEPYAWIINQSLAPLAVSDPVLRGRQRLERSFIREVREVHATRTALIPWQIDSPVGPVGLQRILGVRSETMEVQSKPKVLFLCTGNSCRSQMAEGWARHLLGDRVEPYSAGIEAHGLNPKAVRVMREAGVDITGQTSKLVSSLDKVPFDLVITVCGHADENCPALLRKARVVHVGFDDPPKLAKSATTEEEALGHYRRVRDEIRHFVETRLSDLVSATGSWFNKAGSVDHDRYPCTGPKPVDQDQFNRNLNSDLSSGVRRVRLN